jgi:tetratricopeptide (TPR) repeat protein
MSKPKRAILGFVALLLLGVITQIQPPLHELHKQFVEKNSVVGNKEMTNTLIDQSLQFFGAAALGLRQAVASMLWVRADEFFHNGEYETIVPLVRLVTWLDPKQIDVYSTGAWHLDYNFVDPDQRSDKRYIPPAIKLLEEGIQNNSETYDLYFDLAWMHYFNKIKDYDKAAEWMEKAVKLPGLDPNTGAIIPRPGFVGRMLAHAYEKAGKLDKAEKQWNVSLAEAYAIAKRDPKGQAMYMEVDICNRNLGLLLLREAWRNGDMGAYARGIEVLSRVKNPDALLIRSLAGAKKNYAELKAKGAVPHDTQPPVDANFRMTWKRVRSKVIVLDGQINLVPMEAYKNLASEPFTSRYQTNLEYTPERRLSWVDMSRMRFMIADKDYDYTKLKEPDSLSWDVDKTQTILIDDTAVRNGKFHIVVDMSKDPNMYPFAKKEYRLLIWFNPLDTNDDIQDRIGWKGEGLTDKNYLDTKTYPGVRVIRREFILKKSDII